MASAYYGSRGNGVKEMQQQLNQMGAGLKVDGIWGDKTEAAYSMLMGADGIGSKMPDPSAMFARYEYTAPTDDQLAEKARAAVSGEYDAMEASEKQRADRLVKSLQESIAGLDPKYAEKLDLLEGYYADSRQDISNQAIKRGMGRSSLYLETLTKNHDDLMAAKQQANTEYQGELAKLSEEIRQAQYDLDTNLGSISAKRESEIRKYMDDLAVKRDSTLFDMLKYNNDIAQQEYEYYAGLLEQMNTTTASGSGSSGGGGRARSGRKSSGSSSNSSNSYTTAISNWGSMSDSQKVNYFNQYGASLRLSNTKAYNQMKVEVDNIKKSLNKYGSTNKNYSAGTIGKAYSVGR